MESVLTIRAGARARERLKTHGLDPGDVEIVPGAAGGPKGLGIAGLDRAISLATNVSRRAPLCGDSGRLSAEASTPQSAAARPESVR